MAENFQNASYDLVGFSSTLLTLSGTYGMIPAGPDGTPAAMVKVHGTYQIMVVTWAVTQTGAPPAAPKPQDLDINTPLLSHSIGQPFALPIAPSGKHCWGLTGTYYFQVVTPVDPAKGGLPGGRLPVDDSAAGTNAYPATAWDDSLLVGTAKLPKKPPS